MLWDALYEGISTLTRYPDPDYRWLRQLLSQHHDLEPSWILPGNGAAELLTWIGRDLSGCDRIYLMTPAFGDYQRALAAFKADAEALPLQLTRFPHVLSMTLPYLRYRDGILLNNPHNPTGCLLTAAQLLPLLESKATVVVDEAFMDFLRPDEQQSLASWLPHFPNLIVLRSLTKFYSLPGLRLGYALLHPERAARWQQWRDPWPVNQLAVLAAKTALEDRTFQEQTWCWLSQAKQQLLSGLSQLPGLAVYPGAANFLLVRCDCPVLRLQEVLLQLHRILIRDCMSFPELGDRFFRVAVRTEAENQRLLQALTSVLENPCSMTMTS